MCRRIFDFGSFLAFVLFWGGSVFFLTPIFAQTRTAPAAVSSGTVSPSPETPSMPIFSDQNAVSVSEKSEKKDAAASGGSVVLSNGVRQMLFSIGVVTILFMVLILILKKCSPKERELAPEVFEILGKARFMHRQQICLMRCGQKLFLVSVSQNGVDRIGEIDDPAEVDRLTRRCHGEILGTAMPRVRKDVDGENS